MTVSGFTILRHCGALGYPFVESIRSVLPLVDEFIAVVAEDDDQSGPAIEALDDRRIRLLRSPWQSVGIGGVELARQTNLALGHCAGAWAIYLQADELIHEDDHESIRRSMRDHLTRDTEGLLFDYLHFYRSYRWIANDWQAFYPCAVRVVRTGLGIESAGDAAGFIRRRAGGTRGLIKAGSGARIFHYGWAGSPEARLARAHRLRALSDGHPSTLTLEDLAPPAGPLALRPYEGSHPSPIRALVAGAGETFTPQAIVKTPAWFRAWRDALGRPRSFHGWARVLLPPALTNMRWRMAERRDRRAAAAQR